MERLDGYEVRPVERPEIGVRGQRREALPGLLPGRRAWASCGTAATCASHRSRTSASRSCSATSTIFSTRCRASQVEGAFLPVVAPTSISVDHTNEYYASHEEYLAAVADALHEEYATITDAGLIVQLDDAILTHCYDRMQPRGRRLSQVGGAAGRSHQPRAARHSRGAGALPRVLGLLARTAHQRRAAARDRRPDPEDQRAGRFRSRPPIHATSGSGRCGRT